LLENQQTLFNTDLDCGNLVQELGGYSWGGPIPVSELMLSKTNGRMYSVSHDFDYVENYNISEYDKDLDSVTYVYDFTGSFSSQVRPFGNLNETNENIYLLALFLNSTNTSVVLCRYNIDNHTVDSLANISTIGYECYEDPFYFLLDEGTISITDVNDSCIYGVTTKGGDNNKGILFKYDIVNETLTKMIDFDDTYKPTGYLFKTKANKLYYTSDDKLMEYDNINDTLIIVSQFPSTIPGYLVEGYNNEFYGVYGCLLEKLDLLNSTMDTIFNICSIPVPTSYDDPGETIISGNHFYEKITFLSNGNIVGFYGYMYSYEYGTGYDINLFNLVNEYSNYWTFHPKGAPTMVEGTHLNQKMIEVCYPVSVNVTEIIEAGDSVFLEDEYQTTAGIYHDTFQNYCGCDSSVTTQLIVADILYQDTITICDGDTAYIGTTPVTEAGMYYETYSVAVGDSIHQLELIVNPSFISNTSRDICPGDSTLFQGNYYTIGSYHLNFLNEFGCDSVYSLTVYSTVQAVILNNNSVFYIGNTYHFYGHDETSSYPYIYDYQWVITPSNFNSGALDNFELSISFQDTVEYTIMLLKTSDCGTDTAYFTVHPEIFIGVDDYSIYSDIRVFPNPAKEFVTIKTKFNKIEQIVIFDISGRNIKSIKNINDNKILDIDLSQFEKGIYSLKIITNKGIILKKLIVE